MTIIDFLEASVKKAPSKTAFRDANKQITYKQLWEDAGRIGTFLHDTVNDVNRPVIVMIGRNVESIAAFMGVVMSRNFYVPVDDAQPAARIETIIRQICPAAIIVAGKWNAEVEVPAEIPIVEYGTILTQKADWETLSGLRAQAVDTDPLYAICTSGSTGVPKAVLISHRSVLDFIPVFCETFAFDESEVFGNQAPFDFDVSVKDIYSTLYCTASMFIIPKVCFTMPKMLVKALIEQSVTTIIWAVSALCIAADVNAFKKEKPASIRNVLFSGEVMPVKSLNKLKETFPDATFVNLYGPTEITCNCMYYVVDREFSDTDKLPLGKAFKNEKVYVLGEDGQPVQTGQTGEICVAGTCLALGYYKNPEKTNAAFVQNPLQSDYPELVYRTGDLAQLREDGDYYFAARKDFQIKHMGHRIELEEIELHLNSVDGVKRAACLFDENRNKIAAVYAGDITDKEILQKMRTYLPKYMLPNVLLKEEALPLNKNGKIDRKALREVYEEAMIA